MEKQTDARLLQNLSSSHEEADTLLILHSIYVDQAINSTDTDIIIRSPDTDVFLVLIAFCQKYTHPIYFDTGMGNKRKMIHTQTLCEKIEQDVLDSILGLHAFTGCDANSAFVKKGKSKPLNILKKNPEFAPVFKELASSVTVSDELHSKLEKIVCQLYGKPSYSSTNKLRHDLVRQKYTVKVQNVLSSNRGFDISLLPPCRAAFKFHCLRANYQTLIWKQTDIAQPYIPDPEDHGWKTDGNGVLSIHWCSSSTAGGYSFRKSCNSTAGK
ncbi:DNA damage-inducible protein DIN7 [Elysia marginata]|uniref:DNA damage-inducible protein DIN7 n=1 Tax=Elysia marginata TaxID=1093978 RepID=A0AAV4G381_9GAST|nr:DNA damage-inducible protein DIN7 [Elysia marginata]